MNKIFQGRDDRKSGKDLFARIDWNAIDYAKGLPLVLLRRLKDSTCVFIKRWQSVMIVQTYEACRFVRGYKGSEGAVRLIFVYRLTILHVEKRKYQLESCNKCERN